MTMSRTQLLMSRILGRGAQLDPNEEVVTLMPNGTHRQTLKMDWSHDHNSTIHNGIPEHVIEGETGFLVREFDYESMAERMIELASDENQRTLFGLNGRRNVLKICAPEQRRLELLKLLEKLSDL